MVRRDRRLSSLRDALPGPAVRQCMSPCYGRSVRVRGNRSRAPFVPAGPCQPCFTGTAPAPGACVKLPVVLRQPAAIGQLPAQRALVSMGFASSAPVVREVCI